MLQIVPITNTILDLLPSSAATSIETEVDNWPTPEKIQAPLPVAAEFNLDHLPALLRPWVRDITERMQCPVDFVAVASLVVFSSVVGARCGIRPKRLDNWTVVPNLWGGVVGEPGVMKSPALKEAMSPLEAVERAAFDDHAASMVRYAVDKIDADVEKRALTDQLKEQRKNPGPNSAQVISQIHSKLASLHDLKEPACKRFITNDSTIEKMVELLSENPGGLLHFRDELVGLLATLEDEKRASDRAFYLEAWGGNRPHTADRIGRGTIHADNVCISLLGGIQPSRLLEFMKGTTSGMNNDGLIQRLQLMIYPPTLKDWRFVDRPPKELARALVFRHASVLISADYRTLGAEGIDANGRPWFRFENTAQLAVNQWFIDLQQQKVRGQNPPYLIEHLSKYRSLMPSLALIIHLIDVSTKRVNPGPVTLDAANKAISLCEYFESHARRIYAITVSQTLQAAKLLSDKLVRGDLGTEFSLRDVYRNGGQGLNDKDLARAACNELVDAGWVRLLDPQASGATGGRPPARRFQVNPKVLAQDFTIH